MSEVTSEEASSEDTSSAEVSLPPDNEAYTINGLIYYNRLMETYGRKADAITEYAGYLKMFDEYLGPDIKLYSMPLPSAAYIYAPQKFIKYRERQQSNYALLRESLEGVTDINVLPTIDAHANEDLYYHSDHHWNALGAYYAAEVLAETCGVPFIDLENEYIYHQGGDYTGTLFKEGGSLPQTVDKFYWYTPDESKIKYTVNYYTIDYAEPRDMNSTLYASRNTYQKFLFGDSNTAEIITECDNGRVLLLIKDSYGNALPQYLLKSFSKIYVIDIRYFRLAVKEFAEARNVTDAVIALSPFSVGGGNSKLERLMRDH